MSAWCPICWNAPHSLFVSRQSALIERVRGLDVGDGRSVTRWAPPYATPPWNKARCVIRGPTNFGLCSFSYVGSAKPPTRRIARIVVPISPPAATATTPSEDREEKYARAISYSRARRARCATLRALDGPLRCVDGALALPHPARGASSTVRSSPQGPRPRGSPRTGRVPGRVPCRRADSVRRPPLSRASAPSAVRGRPRGSRPRGPPHPRPGCRRPSETGFATFSLARHSF